MCDISVLLAAVGTVAMAKRIPMVTEPPGELIRHELLEHAARTAERVGDLPGSPWLRRVIQIEAAEDPVPFSRWQVRAVWPDAQHGTRYILNPDNSVREAVKDDDTWR